MCQWPDGEVFRVLFVPHVLTNETEALCNLEVNDIAAYSQSRTVCTIASHNYYTMIKCRLRNLPISHLRDSAKTWLKHGWGIYFRNICWWCNRTNLKPEQNDLLSHNKKNFTKNMEGEEKHCRNETTLGDCFGQHRIRIQSARDGQVAFPVCRWLQSWHEFSWKPKKGSSHT